jgi:hypothetical protein
MCRELRERLPDIPEITESKRVYYSGAGTQKRVDAFFSPSDNFNGLGSDADRSLIQPFLNHVPPAEWREWVAGHLLNADFGGPGNQNWNITPLTESANRIHAVIENAVRENQRQIGNYFSDPYIKKRANVILRQCYTVELRGDAWLYADATRTFFVKVFFQVTRMSEGGIWWDELNPVAIKQEIDADIVRIRKEVPGSFSYALSSFFGMLQGGERVIQNTY